MSVVLEVADLTINTPGGSPLLSHLSFSLRSGQILAITGPNGIGKTTLLQALLLDTHSSHMIWNTPPHERAYLPQLHNQYFHINLTLQDVLSFADSFNFQRIEEESFGLISRTMLERAWNTASGGERQKTLITRLLLKRSKVLILDEPMNHLDKSSQKKVIEALHRFAAQERCAVLMVTHEQHANLLANHKIESIDLEQWASK
jgi:ATPase subunit of ABC transporter with duplicated ATPase domains